MKINKISITNVKSFQSKTTIEFDTNFNIIVGANASGKSNLLDILTMLLRGFFLKGYIINAANQSSTFSKPTIQYNNIQTSSMNLEKYLNNTNPSLIEITFEVTQIDIDNIKSFKENSQSLIAILESEFGNTVYAVETIRSTNWDENELIVGDLISYEIEDNVLVELPHPLSYVRTTPQKDIYLKIRPKYNIYLKYLNLLNLFNLFGDRLNNLQFQNPFLLFSPYRTATNNQDFQAALATTSSAQLAGQLINTNSKTTTSLIKMASTYFAEKLRDFESQAKSVGFEHLWNTDAEVKLVTSYLDKLGYSWKMNLIDRNQNIYEIQLTKDGQELMISQTSSGEKEIINYLFGIFAMKVKNGLIIIDEPELHLHPRWQLLLLDLFKELSYTTNNQFIITTHSPVFINIHTVSNLIRIFRSKKESKYVDLKGKPNINVKDLLHLVNSTNNEKIFFSDHLILVEGVTDHLVFQKIVDILVAKHNILSVIEVVEIKGKGNIKRFRKYLKDLEIPYSFIADLDYVHEVGSKAIHDLFDTDLGAVDSNAIKNGRSTDGKKLIELLEDSISRQDLSEVTTFLQYMKSFRKKLKDNLTAEEQKILNTFILQRQKEKDEYILEDGAIEKYFPIDKASKDLDNVLDLLSEESFTEWQKTDQYKKLEAIVVTILQKSGLLLVAP